MGKIVQFRLIVGGNKYWPDVGSAVIAGYKDGWSHVDTVVPAGISWATEGWLYGARSDKLAGVPTGVWLRPPGYTTFRRCGILTVPITDQQFDAFWKAEHAKIGLPYDWRAIVAFALPWGMIGKWNEPDSWICSAKCEDSCEQAGIMSPFYLAPYKISPGMFAARVEVMNRVWFTEIAIGTDPWLEAAIAMADWRKHIGAA